MATFASGLTRWDRRRCLLAASGLVQTSTAEGVSESVNSLNDLQAIIEAVLGEEIDRSRSLSEQLDGMVRNLPGYVFRRMATPDGQMTMPFLSARIEDLLGDSVDEFASRSARCPANIDPDYRDVFTSAIDRTLTEGSKLDVEYPVLVAGRRRWLRTLSIPRRLEDGTTILDGITLDVTESKEASDRAKFLATYDPLTGLLNRAAFVDAVEEAIAQSVSEGSGLAVLSIDIDRFSTINAELGWKAGNQLLVVVGERLKQFVGTRGFVGYSGQDGFLVAIRGPQGSNEATLAGRLLRDEFMAPVMISGRRVLLSICVGAALYPDQGTSATSVIVSADQAMRHARTRGFGSVEFASELEGPRRDWLSVESDLRTAISSNQFELNYQPQWTADGQTLTGLEALVRWRHPTRGLLMPSEFIEVAELCDLIVPLGNEVARLAIHQLREWRQQGISCVPVGINLAARQLADSELVERIVKFAADADVPLGLLRFEITETVALNETPALARVMADLRQLGAGLCIDDFGVGYTSLRLLANLAVDVVKIDRSFVSGLPQRRQNQAIIWGLVTMGRHLGVKILAEGVEYEDEAAILREIGCDEIQGYLFGRPADAEATSTLLKQHPSPGSQSQ